MMTDEADKIVAILEATRTPGTLIPWTTPDYSAFNAAVERLAKRLGVEPCGDSVGTMLHGGGGRRYELVDLMHAMLDRFDAAGGGEK